MKRLLLISLFFIVFIEVHAKAFDRTERVLFTDYNYDFRSNWRELGVNTEDSIKALLELLIKSETGKKIVAAAKKKSDSRGKTLLDIISPGEGSLCDTTLVRRFYPSRPHETIYESHSTVILNSDLSVRDAVLDLAHELYHYAFRTPFNPYRLNFSLEEFVKSTIEGRGGEVEAYMVECKVRRELFASRKIGKNQCALITDQRTRKLSKKKAVSYFFKVGNYMSSFQKVLAKYSIDEEKFPLVNDSKARFISSAYGVPYPLAAVKEYVSIMNKACDNDYKRLALIRKRKGRVVASLDKAKSERLYLKMKKNYLTRCQLFESNNPFR